MTTRTAPDQSARPRIGITGATGHLGGLIAARLADLGTPQRLLVRTPARAPRLPGASVAQCSYEDTPASREALAGLDVLFMVSAKESEDRKAQHLAFVDAATAADVRHIVYLSFLGAAEDSTFTLARTHWATEERIKASGMTFTFLRDSFYLEFFAELRGEDGIIRGPAGDGRCAAVSRADAAEVAAAVMSDPSRWEGRTLTLTGPERLSLVDVAARIQEVTGQTTSYYDETVEEAYESRRAWPAPAWQYDAWVSTYTAIAAGELDVITDDVEEVLGRPPRSFEDVLRNRRDA